MGWPIQRHSKTRMGDLPITDPGIITACLNNVFNNTSLTAPT